LTNGKKTYETALTAQTSHNNHNSNKNNSGILAESSPRKEIVYNVERKVTNLVTVGKNIQTKISAPTIENQFQEHMNQLMWQPLQVINTTVFIFAHAKSEGLLQSYTLIADSRASSHMVYDETMLVNVKPTVGNDSKLKVLSKEPTMVIPLMIMATR
jgi:hypothetical protein